MGTPPNPPNPGQYPPPNSPRDARRYARAQRHYWQAYWRGGRRPSIIGPIILLAIGIIALLVELGRLNGYAIWNWYVQWWPLLLIVLGLISLAEYFFDRRDPYARRRTGGGLVFLIVILLLIGWGAHSAHRWGHHMGMDNNDFWFMWGQEHDNDVQMDQAAAPNSAITIQNPRGDVTIMPSTDGQIHLRAHEIVHTTSDDDAQKAFDQIHPQIETSGTNITVSVPSHRGSAVNLALQVPEASLVTVNAGHGDVAIEGLKKNADVTAPQGDVKFDGLGGDVTLSEVKGQTTLDGEFFGDTHLEEMDGPIHFHSSRTTIDLPRLGG